MRTRSTRKTKQLHVEQLEKRDLLAADVYISEIAAVNEAAFADDDGDFPDWIEIFNAGPDDVDLDGWHLTDDAEKLRKWSFPSKNLPAGSSLVVYASSKDRADAASPLHANFKLAGDGEYIALTRDLTADSVDVVSEFSPQYPEQFEDISYGVTQGVVGDQVIAGDRVYFETPTPGELNAAQGVEGYLTNEITLSHPAGFYEEAISLTLTAKTADATIRYTTDGSEPTATNGSDYSSPITVSETTTLRARAFKTGVDPSFVETQTFLFLDDVLDQRRSTTIAAGFPSNSSINGQLIDYGMDPAIVNSNTWGPQLMDALKQVPTLSVVMDVDDLMDGRQGIFVNATRQGDAWERAASLELLNPDGTDGFQVNAGIRVRGGYSRRDENPKHSFRFLFREEYGDAKLEYPMFGDEGVDEFDKLDLRTAQNYSWSFGGNGSNTFLRDVFSRDMQREMGQPYTRSRFYHLYLNGQYWGLFQTQERAEARYAAANFGGKRADYDIVKNADDLTVEATDGNLDAYNRLADFFYADGGLSDDNMDAYMRAQGMNPDGSVNPDYERLLDVDNLMDYMIITYYTGDKDGPGSRFTTPRVNNYYAMYDRANPDGWKFFEHDSEHTFDVGDVNMVRPFTTGGSQRRYFNPHWAHEQLARNNSEYRIKFADRVAELVLNDGLLTTDNVNAMINERAAQIDQAIIAESARWGDAKRDTPRTKNDWLSAVQRMRDFAEDREEVLIGQLRDVDWFPAVGPPELNVDGTRQHGGDIETTNRVMLEGAIPPVDFDQLLINDARAWRYLDDGSNQGTAWRLLDFDDDAWETGRAQLGYGNNGERTEVGFGDDSSDKHVTTYFRKTFTTSRADEIEVLKVRLARDDGAVVYLNGQELVRSNMPTGQINYNTGAAGVASGGNETTFFEYQIDADALVNGTNVVAVEVHQVIGGAGRVTSSDITFDLELRGGSQVSAEEIKIYYTTDGSDPRLPGGALAPTAIEYDPNGFLLNSPASVAARSFTNEGEWSPLVSAPFNVLDGGILGDLNNDTQLTAADIDMLVAAIRGGSQETRFDLNSDGNVNDDDRSFMIESIFKTQEGDADLDGDVDFADFLVLSTNFGQDTRDWSDGNFNTDDEVSFADFLLLSTNFGFNRP